jgi:hypothetical protein
VIKDYEKKLYNQPREETALRDGNYNKKYIEKKKHEESNFVRLNKNKREKKLQRKIREKAQHGEKLDNFTELNDIKHYFDGGDEEPKQNPKSTFVNKNKRNKKKIWKGKKLKKFRKK